jgi:hypothetical protein
MIVGKVFMIVMYLVGGRDTNHWSITGPALDDVNLAPEKLHDGVLVFEDV